MKRKRKLKFNVRRISIMVTVLLLLLFGAMLAMDLFSDKEDIPTNEEPPTEGEEPLEEPVKEPVNEVEEPGKIDEPTEEPVEEPSAENPDDEIVVVYNPEAIDVLVNRKHNLSSDYIPADLVKLTEVPTVLSNPEVNQLREPAYNALKELFSKALEEEYELFARSGYRSYNTQVALYSSYVANHGQAAADTFSAKAGQSEHQTGLAMDITCASMDYVLSEAFGETEEGKWVAENAHKFGFIVRYPKGKEEITGYMYEPWHIRYLGIELATKVYESGLTLEEYFEQ